MTGEDRPEPPDDLLRSAMEAALRICAFWSLSASQQQAMLSAATPDRLPYWKKGNLSGLTEPTIEGVARVLEYSRRLADRTQPPEHLGRRIREAIPDEPFHGRCMLDFMLSGDSEMHQELLEYVSGARFPMDRRLLIRTERNFLRTVLPLAAGHEDFNEF